MTVLALETSCDETSAAVLRDGCVLSSIVASQIDLHASYGGVVPELATRQHLRQSLPVLRAALHQASLHVADINAVAVTRGPGLPSALRVGLGIAQAFAFARNLPLISVHHHEGHLYSPWILGSPPRAHWESFQPNVSLIVSGGHTLLVHVSNPLHHRILGGTVDDAAGECFDKSAKLMGLPYPGGPVVDRLATEGNPNSIPLPRPMLHDPSDDFSFSGLKTAVRYYVRDHPEVLRERQPTCDLCASVQSAIVEVLIEKTFRAAERLQVSCVTASGGVACNRELRRRLTAEAEARGWTVRLAEPSLCTDNAAMIGVVADRRLESGWELGSAGDAWEVEAAPGWPLPECATLS